MKQTAPAFDVVTYTYNRLGQPASLTDQNGTIHEFDYDLLGRLIHDRVTTLGDGVDDHVQRLSITYEVRGLVASLTSHDDPAPGNGAILNEVLREYNEFGQVTTSYQAHGGSVNTSTTPKVAYDYANGSNNTIRPTELVYPNGRTIAFGYSGTTAGALSRVGSLSDGSGTLVTYEYLGLATPVLTDYPQPDLRYTLVGTAGGTDPDTGDIYRGLDRFGRIKDAYWRDYGSNIDAARIQYGYNRASSRLWREDPVAAANSAQYDELYHYDGLQRLSDMQRGTLNGTQTALTSETFAQCWTLDATGNWSGMREAATGGAWTLEQERTANPVNEITDISALLGPTWVTPAYDPAGNMTTIPQPKEPTQHYTATYDAWNRLVRLTEPAEPESSSSSASGSSESTEAEELLLASSSESSAESSSSSAEPAEVLVAEYQYDARRFRIIEQTYADGVLDETRHVYFTESWQVLEERLGTSSTPDRQHVWGLRYIDDLILRDRSVNGTLDERLYALQDANWNVIATADEAGDVQERYAYTTYGQPTFLAEDYSPLIESQYNWQNLFTALRWSDRTRLTNARNRNLHNVLGNWTSRDPAGYRDGVINSLYSYAASLPTSRTDPLGLQSDDRCPSEGPQDGRAPIKTDDLFSNPSDDPFGRQLRDSLNSRSADRPDRIEIKVPNLFDASFNNVFSNPRPLFSDFSNNFYSEAIQRFAPHSMRFPWDSPPQSDNFGDVLDIARGALGDALKDQFDFDINWTGDLSRRQKIVGVAAGTAAVAGILHGLHEFGLRNFIDRTPLPIPDLDFQFGKRLFGKELLKGTVGGKLYIGGGKDPGIQGTIECKVGKWSGSISAGEGVVAPLGLGASFQIGRPWK